MPINTKRIRLTAAVCLLLLFATQPAITDAATIETLEEQKEETIEQQKKHHAQLRQLQEYMASLEEREADIQEEIKEYDRRMTIVSEKRYEMERDIKKQQEKIEETNGEIDQQTEAMESYQSYFSERARAMYQSDNIDRGAAPLIKIFLESESFGTFISNIVNQQTILHYDDEMYQKFVNTNQALQEERANKKEELTKLNEKQDTLQLLTERYEALHQERQDYMEELVSEIEETAEKQSQTREYIEQTERQTNQLEQQIRARENRASQAVKSMDIEGSPFITPVNSGYISSNFGRRWGKMHYGTDYGVPMQTSVKAAAAGTVQRASYMNGYGNAVILRHTINGQTYETLYAHLSHDMVEEGQKVRKGEEIAKSGNSGHSLGPHLHFETHVGTWNGEKSNAVDPQTFLN
ncbi:murein hydrolase activator EnvC family protein [Salibacterium aidingense]|uniref:murein hydrolase activator EnvC family protein n=1 Tax=Salibacterium aidingense TaxID=384933 RepID=UPI00042720D7|nr:M23 family metallopeptidase [Salibacterium aidingense]